MYRNYIYKSNCQSTLALQSVVYKKEMYLTQHGEYYTQKLPKKGCTKPAVIVVVILWWLDSRLLIPVQSMPITTKVVSSNPIHGE